MPAMVNGRIIKSNIEARDYVISNFPPGTRLFHRKTGRIFVIGARRGLSEFWILATDEPRRGVEPAMTICRDFGLVTEDMA